MASKKILLLAALVVTGFHGHANADGLLHKPGNPAAYGYHGYHKVEYHIRIHLDGRVVSFDETDWDNGEETTVNINIYPKKVLRVKTAGGQVLLVIPDVDKSDGGALDFLFDDGKKIRELFSALSGGDDVWSDIRLFDLNKDGIDDFIIEWSYEGGYHIDAYSVTGEVSDPVTKIFSTPDLNSPQVPGIDDILVKHGRFFIHYNYFGKEKTAEIRVNKDDPKRQPYIYPLGVTK